MKLGRITKRILTSSKIEMDPETLGGGGVRPQELNGRQETQKHGKRARPSASLESRVCLKQRKVRSICGMRIQQSTEMTRPGRKRGG